MRRLPDPLISLRGIAAGAALMLFSLSGASCGSDGSVGPAPVGSVVVEGPPSLRVGESGQATAVVRNTAGKILTGKGITWQSSHPLVASVDETGFIRALTSGTAQITAFVGIHEGRASVIVLDIPDMVTVAPAHASLIAGDTLRLEATPRSSAGLALTDGPVSWRSSDEAIARVDATGKVTAVAPGRVTISAEYDGLVGTSEIVVFPAVASVAISAPATGVALRDTMRLTAVTRDARGSLVPGRAITWTALDNRASVTTSGLVTALIEGETRIVATSAGVSDTITLLIGPVRVARIAVSGSAFYVAVGDTSRPVVFLYDAYGNFLSGRPVVWASADPSIATAINGVVTGVARGRTSVVVQAGDQSTSFEVIVEGAPASIAFMQDTLRLRVGEIGTPPVELRDALNEVVRDYTVTYQTLDAAVAVPTPTGSAVRGVATGTTLVIAHAGTVADTMLLVVTNADPITITFGMNSTSLVLGARAQVSVHVATPTGFATGRTVRFRSSDARVITVSPASAVVNEWLRPEVEAVGLGTAKLLVEVDGRMASHDVTVSYVPLQSLEIVSAPAILRPGQSAPITTRMVDVRSDVRTYPLEWRSLNTAVATVDGKGIVTAVSVGTAAIIARRDGLADTVTISVQPEAAPTISTITPDVLAPGGTAVIRGQGFSAVIGANQVSIAGVPVTVTAASATELTVVLPAGGYPCVPTGPARVTVTSAGLSGDTLHPLRAARQQPLVPVGQAIVLNGADARCVELAPGGHVYLMTLAFGEPSASASTTLRVRGASGVPLPEPPRAASRMDSARTSPAILDAGSPDRAMRARQAARHLSAREVGPALARRFGPPPSRAEIASQVTPTSSPSLSMRTPVLNEVLTFRVPLFDASNYCADYATVRARVVHVGARSVVLEDVDAPLARTMDDMYRQMGNEYETQMLTTVLHNLGNPLARDAELGQNGRTMLLFSRAVNDYDFLGVFYSACDLYPRSALPASNETPVLYASVPTDPDPGSESFGAKWQWRRMMRAQLVHHTAHLAMDAERIVKGLPYLDLWLDEALASAAVEIFMRYSSATSWKGNATYAQTLWCEVRPQWPECLDRPYGMYDLFASLFQYAREHERRTPFGPTSSNDPTFMGSGWWLLRWAVDHYATNESEFLKSLVVTPLPSTTALSAKTGAPVSQMLADMGMTLLIPYLIPFPVGRPQNTVKSWYWHNIFRGMEADFTQFYGFPAQPRAYVFGNFDSGPFTMSGGEVMYLELVGTQTQNQLISVTGIGQAAPTSITLEIVRAQPY